MYVNTVCSHPQNTTNMRHMPFCCVPNLVNGPAVHINNAKNMNSCRKWKLRSKIFNKNMLIICMQH